MLIQKGLDPRIDLRLSEGYERYSEEEMAGLLERDENSDSNQTDGQVERRRIMMSKYNQLGMVVLNAVNVPQTRNRTSGTAGNPGSTVRQLM